MHNTCNSLSTAKMNGLNTSERYGKGRLDQPKSMYWTSYDNGGYEDYCNDYVLLKTTQRMQFLLLKWTIADGDYHKLNINIGWQQHEYINKWKIVEEESSYIKS